ncbi:MAG TPA: bacteriophage abortive infection AbiH family protein [Candidatus Alistipes stercoravium]|nr:bacteriophage abortive infection AbiH family protein [Candidatus Alistipes stercoravium]
MNRIILFGYGFDLAHDLPTSYKDFINHYRSNRKIHAEQLDFPTTHSREMCAFLKIAVNRICQYIHTGQHNDASDKDTRLPAGRALLFGRLFHIRQTIICVSCRSQSLFSAGESSLPFQGPPTGKSASPSESARNAPA